MCEDRMKTLKTCKNSENLPPVNFLCFVIIPANKQQKAQKGAQCFFRKALQEMSSRKIIQKKKEK